MHTSEAVRQGSPDSTPIDKLKVHWVDGDRALCQPTLIAIFANGDAPVTCRACLRKFAAIDAVRHTTDQEAQP